MRFLPFLLFVFAVGCSSSGKYQTTDPSEINKEHIQFAEAISNRIMSALQAGSHYTFKDGEATSIMKEKLDETKQKETFEIISGKYGDYQDLEFVELVTPTDGTLYEIYRFKGKFSSDVQPEVRAVLDGNQKLAGFFVKPWKKNL